MTYTKRQLEILRFIQTYTAREGQPPLQAEIAEALGIEAVTAWDHVDVLLRKQAIRRHKHNGRTIEILDTEFDPVVRACPLRRCFRDMRLAGLRFMCELHDRQTQNVLERDG